jgi:heat shock protein HtpX
MISALRKIEGRGELPGATSVMEMHRQPARGIFQRSDTHLPIDARVAALVKFAGGHDPGRLRYPRRAKAGGGRAKTATGPSAAVRGKRNADKRRRRPLPARPPIELGSPPAAGSQRGPWGPHRK